MNKILYVVSLLSIGITHSSAMDLQPNLHSNANLHSSETNNKIFYNEIPQNSICSINPLSKNVENNFDIKTPKIKKITETEEITTTTYKSTKVDTSNSCDAFNISSNTHSIPSNPSSRTNKSAFKPFFISNSENEHPHFAINNWQDIRNVSPEEICNAEMFITSLCDNHDNWNKYELFFRKAVSSINKLTLERFEDVKITFDQVTKKVTGIDLATADIIQKKYLEIYETIKKLAQSFIVNEALTGQQIEMKKAISFFNQTMRNLECINKDIYYHIPEGIENNYYLQVFIPSVVAVIRSFFSLDLRELLKQSLDYKLLQDKFPIKVKYIQDMAKDDILWNAETSILDALNGETSTLEPINFLGNHKLKSTKLTLEQLKKKGAKLRAFGKNQHLLWIRLLQYVDVNSKNQELNSLRDVIFNPSYPNISINIDLNNIYKYIIPHTTPEDINTIKYQFYKEFEQDIHLYDIRTNSDACNTVDITYSDIKDKSDVYEKVYSAILSTLMILLNHSNNKYESDVTKNYILKILSFPRIVKMCELKIPYYSDSSDLNSVQQGTPNYLNNLLDDISNDTQNIQFSHIMNLSNNSLKLLNNIESNYKELQETKAIKPNNFLELIRLISVKTTYTPIECIIKQHNIDLCKILDECKSLETCLNGIKKFCSHKTSDSKKLLEKSDELLAKSNELNNIVTHLQNRFSKIGNIGFNIVQGMINSALTYDNKSSLDHDNFTAEQPDNFQYNTNENYGNFPDNTTEDHSNWQNNIAKQHDNYPNNMAAQYGNFPYNTTENHGNFTYNMESQYCNYPNNIAAQHGNFSYNMSGKHAKITTKNHGHAQKPRNMLEIYSKMLLSIDNKIREAINNTQELICNLHAILFQLRAIQFINLSPDEKNDLKQKINNEISNFMKEPHTIQPLNLIININYEK